MSGSRRPEMWLALGLALTAAVGGEWLSRPACVQLSQRDRYSYGQRPRWQAHFDALSATCGVGLLTYDLREDYTPLGRSVLAALGVVGAALYLAAARQALGRIWPGLPPIRAILAAYVAVQAVFIPAAAVAERFVGGQRGVGGAAFGAVSAFSSLGFWTPFAEASTTWVYVIAAGLGALGWPVWLGTLWRKELRRVLLAALLSYAAFLVASAALVNLLESPRAVPRSHVSPTEHAPRREAEAGLARRLQQVIGASGGGLPIEALGDRAASEGSKLVLSIVVLVGGLGGAAGGGIRWSALAIGLAAVASRRREFSTDDTARRCVSAGIGCAAVILLLWFVVALGLLLIETRVGSAFQAPPTVADALVDAASAVAGAGLTSGLTATVTGANLSIGIRQNVDVYQYGMAWLMLAMFLGRVLPVLMVRRAADLRFTSVRASLPPLI